jgi:hypothetical protein
MRALTWQGKRSVSVETLPVAAGAGHVLESVPTGNRLHGDQGNPSW